MSIGQRHDSGALPIANYSSAIAKAVEWLGDRYLLAKPINAAPMPLASVLTRIRDLARDGLSEARRSVLAIRPAESRAGGLEFALRQLAERSTVQGRLNCVFEGGGVTTKLAPEHEHELLRIAQEAVSNAVRHAQPRNVQIAWGAEREFLQLSVTDDGCGMQELPELHAQQGFGLTNMRERAHAIGGEWQISSQHGAGTRIDVRVPIVNQQADMVVVGEAGDGEEAIALFHALKPDVMVLDLRMPKHDGVTVVQRVIESDPGARMLIMTTYDGDEDIFRSLSQGAKGYILKDAPRQEILTAIRAVNEERTYTSSSVAAKALVRMGKPSLTQRELDVLQLLAEGRSNKDIARRLDITEGTAKTHVKGILTKLDAISRTEAVTVAHRRGLVRLS